MNVLVLYDRYSTHTNTVYEHLCAIGELSEHLHHFLHCAGSGRGIDWHVYDVVVVHYSARLVANTISRAMLLRLAAFDGLKVMFVQDEYDLTERLHKAIHDLDIGLVFTCVPELSIERIYPAERFTRTRFVNTLTGFAPAPAPRPAHWIPIAERSLWVGYRGRALPFWYGDLGQEKQAIAERMRLACVERDVPCDIEWNDSHRIYGDAWTTFLSNCRATLGTESGSNVFDDDGTLRERVCRWQRDHPNGTYAEARHALMKDSPEEPLMNQVSPRIFEAVAAGTGLVLFEGTYSGVVRPNEHYIPLRKDFSNIDEVLVRLADVDGMEAMINRAWDDVIGSGIWSYFGFIASYDRELNESNKTVPRQAGMRITRGVTIAPERTENVKLSPALAAFWHALPLGLRTSIYPLARAVVNTLRTSAR